MLDDIPFDWTPDQALAVLDFLEDLADHIWSRYGLAIRGSAYGPEPPAPTSQLTLPFPPLWLYRVDAGRQDLQDDIPF
jgi:hypothetical protein